MHGVVSKVKQYWKTLKTETRHQIIVPIILSCIIVLYIAVQIISMAMLIFFGVHTTGYGSGYFSQGGSAGGRIMTSKSIGTYHFTAENGKQYTARFSVEGRRHWSQSVLIYYQKGFPYNNTYGEPTMKRAVQECALPAVAGIVLLVYVVKQVRKDSRMKR